MRVLAVALAAAAVLAAGSTANINGNAYGNPKAPVVIEVFSDFQCPSCKAFHDNEFQQIMRDYIVPGKVYFIYRYFPLPGHPYGRPCAEFACAAARVGRYQKVAEALFAQQINIAYSGKVEDVVNSVLTPTESKMVKSLLKDPAVQREIQTDLDEGKLVPVAGTPTLWVTHAGKSQPVSWPMNYGLFKSYVDSLLPK
ncbi:MAG TPA: thioredoxin domain-containing protein [Bryobacteraceae bacterium]|nr:thioredoxin domain-containing protein [Bryobacteraceae bacterium]